jgi:hypothetical protein
MTKLRVAFRNFAKATNNNEKAKEKRWSRGIKTRQNDNKKVMERKQERWMIKTNR